MNISSQSPSPVFAGRSWRARLRVLCVYLMLAGGAVRAADSSEPLGLFDAIELAERDAPMLAARRAAIDAARYQIGPAGQMPDPELVAGVENLPVNGADAFSLDRDFMSMRRIGVMQTFPRAEKRRLRSERATADAERERAMMTVEQLSTEESVAIAWIALKNAQQRLALVQSLQVRADAMVAAATAAIGSGRGNAADAIVARQARLALHDRIDVLRLQRDQAQHAFARWLPDDAERALASAPDWNDLGTGARGLENFAQHRELLAYDAITHSAELDIALARAERRPDWSLELAYADRGPGFSSMVSLQFRIGLPLFAARRQEPIIAAREAVLRQVELERADAERMHRAELADRYAAWRNAGQRARRYEKESLPLSDDLATAALAAYRGGSGSLQNVLAAFDAALEQRLAYVDVLDALAREWATLYFAFAREG
jgi:cobalt-zinc-cadmium efflux system outer membrane protein